MSFEESLAQLVARLDAVKENVKTEEATKTSLIMPFFQALGYDVFNPMEFIPEYTADVGIKKGEKVDYAICLNEEIQILIEAKSINESLENHGSQLFRYFGTSSAKFGILTNGINYRFYTDLDDKNKMDSTPFFEIDLTELTDSKIDELKKFCKSEFDLDQILDTASDLKYSSLIKKVLKDEFASPSDDFVRFILNQNVYDGQKNQNVIDRYKPLVKKSIMQYINEMVNDKIKNALKKDDESPVQAVQDEEQTQPILNRSEIETTEDEMQAYYIVLAIISKEIDIKRVSFKDTKSYFSIIVDKKVTRWICRLFFKESVQFIIVNIDGKEQRLEIENLSDIYKYSDTLIEKVKSMQS